MKKTLHSILFFLAVYSNATFAQTFSVSGPRTVFELSADRGTGKYTFFNFNTGKEIAPDDSNTVNWHVAFSTTTIIFNGGVSGPGTVTAQVLSGTSFASQTTAPEAGYVADAAIKAVPTGSGKGWYMSNSGPTFQGPHTITPIADRIIAVKLADGRYVKMQMLNYYKGVPTDVPVTGNGAYTGIARYVSFRYLVAEEASTDWSQEVTKVTNLAAPSNVPKYFNIASATVVSTEEKEAKATWNLLLKNPSGLGMYDGFNVGIYGNSGANASDNVGTYTDSLQLVSSPFHLVNEAPLKNWTSSESPAPVWYAYSGAPLHLVNPIADKEILVKTSLKRYAKIRVDSYYKNGDNSNNEDYGYYNLTYYFQPDGTTDLTTTPDITTGIFNVSSANTLSLYPNPVAAETTALQSDLELTGASVKIMNMQGTEVYATTFNGNLLKLNSNLTKGMYLVVVSHNDTMYQQKLIVE